MNIILFLPDELRADALRCYGNPVVQTPAFDRLAREGVRFSQCHVQSPVCSPSRCALFTGRYPHADGHRGLWSLLQPHEHNLADTLKQAGWDVQIFGKNDLFSQAAIPLCTSGFEDRPHRIAKLPANTCRPGEPGYYDFLYEPLKCKPEDHKDAQNLGAALEYLREQKPDGKPFFLFLPLDLPHCPYTVMEPFYSRYDPGALPPLPCTGHGKPEFHRLSRAYRNLEGGGELRKLRAVYYGMVSYTDWLLSRLLDCLDETGLAEDTLLVAASDHGDYAGDYGLPEKWPSGMEDALTRVPLLVRGPGCRAGHTVENPVELFDLMPTLLGTAGVPPRRAIQAQSLWPQLSGGMGDPERTVFCEGGYNPGEWPADESAGPEGAALLAYSQNPYYPKSLQQKEHPESVCRTVMARTLQHKLVLRSNGEHEFYDLQADPAELRNRYGDPALAPVTGELERRLLLWYLDTSDCIPLKRDFRGVKPE